MMNLNITQEEAIVLINLLKRYSETDSFVIEDQSEQRALWNLECAFESADKGVIKNWNKQLEQSQAVLRDEKKTNATFEKQQGKLALWLTPEDIVFVTNEYRKIPSHVSSEVSQTWARIAFHANATLHKYGIEKTPEFPSDEEKYL